ncbi:hypothetical protein BSM4216_0267 [Bacillus smithii]|jgi:hypothetical protein|nr:hypothetical protein BSM4216_0267 [Bacillus smithii]
MDVKNNNGRIILADMILKHPNLNNQFTQKVLLLDDQQKVRPMVYLDHRLFGCSVVYLYSFRKSERFE